MTVFVSGGAKSGKSSLAQDLALALARGGKRYYVATLIPSGPEDQERIRLHLEDRAGMGFETLECFTDVTQCLKTGDPAGTFLVDSVTSLLQNALFPVEKNYEMDLVGARRCGDGLVEFASRVANAIFVSDYIYADGEDFSESTQRYRQCLTEIDRRLAKVCDVVIEASCGQFVIHKGDLCI